MIGVRGMRGVRLWGREGREVSTSRRAWRWASHQEVPQGRQPARLLCPWASPGQKTGTGCHALLQGILLTQG